MIYRTAKYHVMLLVMLLMFSMSSTSSSALENFDEWLAGLRTDAIARGISVDTLDAALKGLKPVPRVIELDRRQPEFTQGFREYLNSRVSENRIKTGRRLLRENSDLLEKIGAKYGVQPRFLVAIWGLETNFGTYTGGFQVIDSLATLAYDERRSSFFRKELLNALAIIDEGHIKAPDMNGSWAGAMGQVQFMPSSFARFAVDADGDGRKDIWNSLPDIFESAANYLAGSGWNRGYIWGREVKLPSDFKAETTGLDTEKTLAGWQELGIRLKDGRDLPSEDIKASIIMPAGDDGPALLVYENYRAIMKWNNSHNYAISVCHLADRLIGKGPLQGRGSVAE
jgi:membrane-bound lytic murein transglycosylase B